MTMPRNPKSISVGKLIKLLSRYPSRMPVWVDVPGGMLFVTGVEDINNDRSEDEPIIQLEKRGK